MYRIVTTRKVNIICLVTLAWLLTGCSSSDSDSNGGGNSDTNTTEELSFSLSITSLELSTTPGGPGVNVNGLPVTSKQLLLQRSNAK